MIDLSVWNLTLPEQVPLRTIQTPQMQSGYNSKYFYRNGESFVFWAPVAGTATGNSDFPRSELREVYPDGKARNWQYSEGNHTLSARLAVNKVPSTGQIVIGQVHAKDNLTPYVKLVYSQVKGVGYVQVYLRQRPNDVKSPLVMTYKSMPLDYFFNYTITITRAGQLMIDIAGQQYVNRIDPSWASKHFYFKAGVYTLDNQGPATEGGQAEFAELNVVHQK